jgi:hypothetical protein
VFEVNVFLDLCFCGLGLCLFCNNDASVVDDNDEGEILLIA